ncbi:MAG TPA: hypothetical protein VNA22_07350 [Pyrinomonadaceae bacterium]|nr:hypothetical protein [Pyrinomonadaceae bacterium]
MKRDNEIDVLIEETNRAIKETECFLEHLRRSEEKSQKYLAELKEKVGKLRAEHVPEAQLLNFDS